MSKPKSKYNMYSKLNKVDALSVMGLFAYGTTRDDDDSGNLWTKPFIKGSSAKNGKIIGFKMYQHYKSNFPFCIKTNDVNDIVYGRLLTWKTKQEWYKKLKDSDRINGYNEDAGYEDNFYLRIIVDVLTDEYETIKAVVYIQSIGKTNLNDCIQIPYNNWKLRFDFGNIKDKHTRIIFQLIKDFRELQQNDSKKCIEYKKQLKGKTLQLNELKKKYKDLMRKYKGNNIDLTKWKEWDLNDIVCWLIGLNNGKYIKYQEIMLNNDALNDLKGKHLSKLDKNDLKEWGINSLGDRIEIYHEISNLIKSDNNDDIKEPEGNMVNTVEGM